MLKITFITEETNYYYKVMAFGVKNVGASNQRLMDKVFKHLIDRSVKVYVDDIVVMSPTLTQHSQDLAEVSSTLRAYNLRLHSDKCVFGVDDGKFLGFMLTQKGIEANPEKCQVIIGMRSPDNIKEVQHLIGRLKIISWLLPRLANKTQPMIKLLKKSIVFIWGTKCQERFDKLKQILTSLPVLCKSDTTLTLVVYITTIEDAVSVTLVQHKEGK